MADEKKTQQINPDDESKKDTVRINLPPGLTGKTAAPATSGPPTVKLKPAVPGTSEDEAKKETAVMGRPAETPKPKSDTSRVQVSGTKPGVPETPRPTVKLKQPEPAATARPAVTPVPAPAAVAVGFSAEPSGALAGLSLAAMVLSVATAAYLGLLAFG